MRTFTIGEDTLGLSQLLERAVEPASLPTIRSLIVELYHTNTLLWDVEDLARTASSDEQLATAKRTVDRLNLERSGLVEQIDGVISGDSTKAMRSTAASAPVHTETIGCVVDRLLILALRLDRTRVASLGDSSLSSRITHLEAQYGELGGALDALVEDVASGARRLPDGRRFKLYGAGAATRTPMNSN